MTCHHCNTTVTPGTEISLGPHEHAVHHCPYCLHILDDSGSATGSLENDVHREQARKEVRRRFIERLRKSSPDGAAHCPICEHRLNENDEALFLSQTCFRCHLCGHDLATYAYRETAYDEKHWLPILYGLADLKADDKCASCSLAGALARACQNTLARTPKPKYYPVQSNLLVNLLARVEWEPPDPECVKKCFAVEQYRAKVGELMKLL